MNLSMKHSCCEVRQMKLASPDTRWRQRLQVAAQRTRSAISRKPMKMKRMISSVSGVPSSLGRCGCLEMFVRMDNQPLLRGPEAMLMEDRMCDTRRPLLARGMSCVLEKRKLCYTWTKEAIIFRIESNPLCGFNLMS
jgi:hypothetical protein